MSEIFKIQESTNWQEAQISLDEWSAFNELLVWTDNSIQVHNEIKDFVAQLNTDIDNFNTWVDKNILVWKSIKVFGVERGMANSDDQNETYNTAKETSNKLLLASLNEKVQELNTAYNEYLNNNTRDVNELGNELYDSLWVDLFVAWIKEVKLIWEAKLDTPDDIQLAEAEQAAQLLDDAQDRKNAAWRGRALVNLFTDNKYDGIYNKK